jgi:hypothetical protein
MKSFLSGKASLGSAPLSSEVQKNTIGSARKHAAASHAANAPHTHASDGSSVGPQIELVKEGGKVVRLVITCTCGERIEVECLYPAGS